MNERLCPNCGCEDYDVNWIGDDDSGHCVAECDECGWEWDTDEEETIYDDYDCDDSSWACSNCGSTNSTDDNECSYCSEEKNYGR